MIMFAEKLHDKFNKKQIELIEGAQSESLEKISPQIRQLQLTTTSSVNHFLKLWFEFPKNFQVK